MVSAREKLAGKYEEEAAAKAAAEKAQKAISGVASVGKGATTFADIDKWLTDNPEAKFFRIENGGSSVSQARTYTNDFGAWSDNDAAIVGQDSDKGARDIFRYANISAADVRTGKRGEKATVGAQYTPSSFFKDNAMDYKSEYGLVYSRDEYANLKNWAAEQGKSDQFLSAGAEKKPVFNSDYGKDKGAILTGAGVEDTRRAGIGENTEDAMDATDTEQVKKRKLLG